MSTALTIVSLLPGLLRTLAGAPASSSFLTPVIDSVLNTIAALVERGDEAAVELNAFADTIKAMVTSGRDPTTEEWAALKAASDAAHAQIQGTVPPAGPPGGIVQ